MWVFLKSVRDSALMQEQAKMEMEKAKLAQEKKDKKEQEKLEQMKLKEEKKKQREENKRKKEAEKAERAEKKGRGKKGSVNMEVEQAGQEVTKKGKAEDELDSPRDAKCRKIEEGVEDASHVATPPKTPKRSAAAAMMATPRQKTMVARTRAKLQDNSELTGESAPDTAGNAKQKAMAEKVKFSYELLRNLHEFAADVNYVPCMLQNPELKSFTVRPFEDPGSKKTIGVILFRSSFYVAKATIPEGLDKILKEKKVTGVVKKDGTGGCSLGWTRFKDVKQACLSCLMGHVHQCEKFDFI